MTSPFEVIAQIWLTLFPRSLQAPYSEVLHRASLKTSNLIANPLLLNLSLRPYATILEQINPNLQSCIIKAVLVLTAIPYQILKILKSNILKIIGIEVLYRLYTYNLSFALVDQLLKPNRLGPITR